MATDRRGNMNLGGGSSGVCWVREGEGEGVAWVPGLRNEKEEKTVTEMRKTGTEDEKNKLHTL